jgi:hypothetical protein
MENGLVRKRGWNPLLLSADCGIVSSGVYCFCNLWGYNC